MGARFKVEYPASLPKDDCGHSLCSGRLIKLSLSAHETEDEMERTFLHEILHMILEMSGQDVGLGDDKEEGIVKALENGLHRLYKRRIGKI